jgi:hypothetical protein
MNSKDEKKQSKWIFEYIHKYLNRNIFGFENEEVRKKNHSFAYEYLLSFVDYKIKVQHVFS